MSPSRSSVLDFGTQSDLDENAESGPPLEDTTGRYAELDRASATTIRQSLRDAQEVIVRMNGNAFNRGRLYVDATREYRQMADESRHNTLTPILSGVRSGAQYTWQGSAEGQLGLRIRGQADDASLRIRPSVQVSELLHTIRELDESNRRELARSPLLRNLLNEASETRQAREDATVIEELKGYVEEIDGDTAYVRLESPEGEILYGQYPAAELDANGIRERRSFLCRVTRTRSGLGVQFQASRDAVLSEGDVERIWREVDAALGTEDSDDAF